MVICTGIRYNAKFLLNNSSVKAKKFDNDVIMSKMNSLYCIFLTLRFILNVALLC